MSTLRAKQRQQAAEAKKLKKVVKPVLSSPFTLPWPELSQNAKIQVEAALTKVLLPLVEARAAVYKPKDVSARSNNDVSMDEDPEVPVASTSALPVNVSEQLNAATTHPHPKWTKRQIRLAKRTTRLERTPGAQLPGGSHDVQLRSGKVVAVPNHAIPEKFFPSMLLNKAAALDARPAICDHLVIGVNAVTRALEEDIEDARRALIGKSAVIREKERVQDSLRCFIPAPNFSTRKQRREVRNALHPEDQHEKSKKRKALQEKVEENQAAMPETINHIPRGDVVLLLTLEDVLADLPDTPLPKPDAWEAVNSVIQHVKGTFEDSMPADMALNADATVPIPTISIPTNLISKLVGETATIDPQAKSILISLLMRHDPSWFASQNKLASLKALQREAQDAAAAALSPGKRRKGTHNTQEPAATASAANTTSVDPAKAKEATSAFDPTKHLALVFVAKDDINPVDIVTHILTAVAVNNSIAVALRRKNAREVEKGKARDKDKPEGEKSVDSPLPAEGVHVPDILLVPLPKGAEARLAELLGIRRVSVLAFTNSQIEEFDQLKRLVRSHLPAGPHADWLVPSSNHLPPADDPHAAVPGRHLLTSIKHLQTHAPTDSKAAKVAKKEAKQARKEGKEAGVQGIDEEGEVMIATQL